MGFSFLFCMNFLKSCPVLERQAFYCQNLGLRFQSSALFFVEFPRAGMTADMVRHFPMGLNGLI